MKGTRTNILTKVLASFLAIALMITMAGFENQTAVADEVESATASEVATTDSETGKVVVSVEKFTIGQGFVLEPVIVEFEGETTVTEVFDKALKAAGIEYITNTSWGSIYLSEIKNADNGNLNIPKVISEMEPYQQWGSESYIYAPTNEVNDGNDSKPNLGEYSYSSMAGWLFTVNGSTPSTGMTDTTISNGDIIRFQFSVYGYGADLGIAYDTPEYPASPANLILPEKEELINTIAIANNAKYLAYVPCKEAYDKAVAVAASYDSTDTDIENAINDLKAKFAESENVTTEAPTTELPTTELPTTEAPTTVAPTTEAPTTKIVVAKTKIKNIQRIKKKKAKITLKKVNGAKGYQIKYSTSKKFKKAQTKTITTKKRTYTIKKLKKGKKYYVKARAYKVVNQKRIYSKWSNVKKVKIKK